MNLLTRYWFVFGTLWTEQVGVTAYSRDDAIALIKSSRIMCRNEWYELPEIIEEIENVDVSTLEKGHILPNIGVCTRRGVWHPNCYPDDRASL